VFVVVCGIGGGEKVIETGETDVKAEVLIINARY